MLIKFIAYASLAAPLAVFAATDLISPILLNVKEALDVVVPIAITLALIYFIWEVVQYVIATGEEEKADARKKMLYGVIGLFVIIAIWGLVNFVATYLGVSPTANPIVVPFIP
mgnify:FL=1